MNTFERSIVSYSLAWAPFGGPPKDEIFPEFGLTPNQFRRRFRRIIVRMSLSENELDASHRLLLESARRAYPELDPVWWTQRQPSSAI